MSEQLDRDLGRAIKDEIGREMQGFEFSALMKANVMKQIRAGQSGLVVPFERTTARRKFVVPRPLIWTAVAVAAFAFAFNLTQGPKDLMMGATESAPGAPSLRMADPAVPAPTEGEPASEGDQSGIAAMNGLSADLVPAPTRMIELHGVVRTPAPALASAPALTAPVPNLQVKSIGSDLVVVSSNGISRLDASTNQVWQNNPGGITPDSALTVNFEGISALSAGNNVHLISPNGVLERTLQVPAPVTDLAWSADNRVAVTAGASLTVFSGDQIVQRLDVAPGARAAFLPNGSLAVYSGEASPKQVAVYDASGGRTFQVDIPDAGQGLAITNLGQTVLAGGVAVDQSGQVLWQLQPPLAGVTAVPTSEVLVAWGGDSVAAVRPDGYEVWRARLEGAVMHRAAISDDGSRVAVVASSGSENRAVIFVLDMAGELLLTEGAASVPVDVVLAGNKLFLLYSQGQQEFALK